MPTELLEHCCTSTSPDVIEQLRTHKTTTAVADLPALITIVRDLNNPHLSLSEISQSCGLSEEDVKTAIIQLGSWITRARGKSGVDIVFLGDVAGAELQMTLFGNTTNVPSGLKKGIADTVDVPAVPAKASNFKRKGRVVLPVTYGNQVLVHESLSPKLIGKDITGSIAEIIAAQPKEADLARYVQRTTEREKMLMFEHVTTVWLFSRIGRLHELREINPTSAALSRCLAEGFDVLELARVNAMRAVRRLCADDVTVDEVRDALVYLRPLAESLIRPLEGLVANAGRSNGERALRTELRWIKRQVEANSANVLCPSIAHLNEGQVLRIAQAAGLHTDGSNRVEESEIRSRLAQMGLSGDADQLVGTGVQAIRLGLNDEFWEAVERRADGDPTWDRQLVSAMRSR